MVSIKSIVGYSKRSLMYLAAYGVIYVDVGAFEKSYKVENQEIVKWLR